MTIEIITTVTIQLNGQQRTLLPGEVLTVSDQQGSKLMAKVGNKVRMIASGIQVGDQISWSRAEKRQIGQVDFIHIDGDGISWAFVSIGKSWTAVNLKFVVKA